MRIYAMVLAFMVTGALGGCATFSLVGGKDVVKSNDKSVEAVFRREAKNFQKQFAKAGWLRSEESKSRSRAFMAFLSKGWSKSKKSTKPGETPKDAVTLYLERLAAKNDQNPGKLAMRVQNDLSKALLAMSQLNDKARALADDKAPLPAKKLRTDVATLEKALMAAHKAQSLFAGAGTRLGKDLSPELRADLAVRLNTNKQEISRMRQMADALNARRLAPEPVS